MNEETYIKACFNCRSHHGNYCSVFNLHTEDDEQCISFWERKQDSLLRNTIKRFVGSFYRYVLFYGRYDKM